MLLRGLAAVHAFNQFFGAIVKLIRINILGVDSIIRLLLTRSIGLIVALSRGSCCSCLANLTCAVDMRQLATLLVAGAGIGIVRALVDMFFFTSIALVTVS